MAPANPEDRDTRLFDEARELFEKILPVVIEIPQRAAENNGVRLELFCSFGKFADMRDLGCRLFHQPLDVRHYILQSEGGNLALALQLSVDFFAPVATRNVRQIVSVTQQIVDN